MALPYRILHDDDRIKLAFIECYRPLQEIKTFCDAYCDKYAYILHDKDVKEDGSPKMPHIHLLAHFIERPRFSSVKRILRGNATEDTTVLGQSVMSKYLAFSYLTHANDPQKHQYSIDEVITNDRDFFSPVTSVSKEEKNKEFMEDLLNEKPYTLAIKYGRDYIKNFKSYNDFKNLILNEFEREYEVEQSKEIGIELAENVIATKVNTNPYIGD